MLTTRDYLAANASFPTIFPKVELYGYTKCLELRWDKSDFSTMDKDSGIAFKTGNRFVVVSLINNELRYYASADNVPGVEWDYEVGCFANSADALTFLQEYLVSGQQLLEIMISRNILRGTARRSCH